MQSRRIAATAAATTALIHVAVLHDHFKHRQYVGALFVLGIAALFYAAMALWQSNDPIGWFVGGATCAGMMAGYLLSRTVGLPWFHVPWKDGFDLGITSLVLEAVFFVAAIPVVTSSPEGPPRPTA